MSLAARIRRLMVAPVATAAIIAGPLMAPTPAYAAYWKVEATWYKSSAGCESRWVSLYGTGLYRDHTCRKNSYKESDGTYRWTLRVEVLQPGDPRLA